ncbi:MAG: hypothetical protein E2P01_05955 [Acidobacteria bacterium]|nr:MAG: hypothetical protein E2P01_05955 [Acidobacteriota bacterium]
MNISLRTTSGLALLLAALLLPFPASAQQDESGDDDDGWGNLIVEFGTWIAEPGGLGDNVVTVIDPTDLFNDTIVGFTHGTSPENYTRFGAEFAGNRGRLLLTWYTHDDTSQLSMRDPGNFIFGELLAFPAFAGLFNNGLADALDASNKSALRDLKIEYSRQAFSNSRVEGRWIVGYRKLVYRTRTEATYYALVPTFPAFLPPLVGALPNLTPIPDTASLASDYTGSGLTGGMEFKAPIWRDKFVLEASFGLSVLLGNVKTEYRAINSLYILDGSILEAPYAELYDFFIDSSGNVIGTAASVQQVLIGAGLRSDSLSRSSQVLEASIGARWSPLSYMDVFLGYRMAHYGGVAVDVRPRNIVVIGSALNAVDASETDRSATYEGFYGGVGFRF